MFQKKNIQTKVQNLSKANNKSTLKISRTRAFILTWSRFEHLVLVPFSLKWNIYFRGVLKENERSCMVWVPKLDWVKKEKKQKKNWQSQLFLLLFAIIL